jgi:hypothetical protein
MIFSNLAGLWALLGIPLVVLIHFLQRKAKTVPVSTLFLLEQTQRDSLSGRRLDRFTPSVPLWLQILFVILLAWLLVEPRYPRTDSVQRVAVVLDSSTSMQAFRQPLLDALARRLPAMQGAASEAEFLVLDSDPEQPRIYAGNSLPELFTALAKWQPQSGTLDPSAALRIARSLVAREGLVVYATDTPQESLPFDAQLLAVGALLENVGFTGVSFAEEQGALVWKALIRNHGTTIQDRSWQFLLPDGSKSQPVAVRIDPGRLVQLQGAFPAGENLGQVVLSADGFAADDVLPLVRPQPKPLLTFPAASEKYADIFARLIGSLQGTQPAADDSAADLSFVAYDPLAPALPAGHSIIFMDDSTRGGQYLRGGIVAERHALLDGLNWQALLVRETIHLDKGPTDQVLLWQGALPLILLRGDAGTQQLVFNFDITLSNADRLPAFVVLVNRFAQRILKAKIAPHAQVYETAEPLDLPHRLGAEAATLVLVERPVRGAQQRSVLPVSQRLHLQAPRRPGHFTVTQGEETLIQGATFFADSREADFSATGASDQLDPAAGSAVQRQTRQDHLWRLWVLAALAALLVAWHFTKNSARIPATA